jgi:hypothetical protein
MSLLPVKVSFSVSSSPPLFIIVAGRGKVNTRLVPSVDFGFKFVV